MHLSGVNKVPADLIVTRRLLACHECGLIHRLPPGGFATKRTESLKCARCSSTLLSRDQIDQRNIRVVSLALSALMLFFPAMLLPILEVERLGFHHRSSLLGGIIELYQEDSKVLAIVILLFSVIVPLFKIAALIELSGLHWMKQLRIDRRWHVMIYRMIEFLGRWSMMDVMLLALLVMMVKLDGLIEFHIGPAAFAFCGCVVLSMLATWAFHPRSVWNDISDLQSDRKL